MTDADMADRMREVARARWGSQHPVRLAAELLPRANELPREVRAELHEATGPETDGA